MKYYHTSFMDFEDDGNSVSDWVNSFYKDWNIVEILGHNAISHPNKLGKYSYTLFVTIKCSNPK